MVVFYIVNDIKTKVFVVMTRESAFRILCILFVLPSLAGCLPTIFTGAAGSAMEFAKDRPAGETLTDARISAGIKADFIKKDFRDLYTKIKIEVVQGRVLLTGGIDKEEDSVKAVEISWNQKGVTEVINELKVDKNSRHFDLLQYTRDTMITSQIKSKTFMNREIKFVNYTVITINDVVYLFGIARSQEELEKVANIASNVYGVQKVISHVKITDMVHADKSKEPSKVQEGNGKFIDDDKVTVVETENVKPAVVEENDSVNQSTKDDW